MIGKLEIKRLGKDQFYDVQTSRNIDKMIYRQFTHVC